MQQLTIPAAAGSGPTDEVLDDLIGRALAEDLGDGDVTTLSTIPADALYTGDFLVKEPGIIAGLAVAQRVFAALDAAVTFRAFAADGDRVARGDVVALVTGPGRALLSGERVALELHAAYVGHRYGHAALCRCRCGRPRGDFGHA